MDPDVNAGGEWQVYVLTPRAFGLSESTHPTPTPCSSPVELKEMDEGLCEAVSYTSRCGAGSQESTDQGTHPAWKSAAVQMLKALKK